MKRNSRGEKCQSRISQFFASKDRQPKNVPEKVPAEVVYCGVENLGNFPGPSKATEIKQVPSQTLTKLKEFTYNADECDNNTIPLTAVTKSYRTIVEKEPKKQKIVELLDARDLRLKLTPLEEQVVEIKQKYPDTILAIECGYKYRFFGEDAELVAAILNIFAHVDHNFLTCSFPTHRLLVHIKRLVTAGYKVGVVRQVETAALKAISETRNAPFKRELTMLYSKATFVEENEDSLDTDTPPLCIVFLTESLGRVDGTQQVGIVAIQTVTGNIFYDSFEDDPFRNKLDALFTHLQPAEIVLARNAVSRATEDFLKNFIAYRAALGDCPRTETVAGAPQNFSESLEFLKNNFLVKENLEFIDQLPPVVVSCLALAFVYLKEYKMTSYLDNIRNAEKFSMDQETMRMDANVLRNLDLVGFNDDKLKQRGTLYSVLNRTRTKLGARLLRDWILKPRIRKKELDERLDCVQWLLDNGETNEDFLNIKKCLKKLPDLEKGLTSILHKRVSPKEFYALCAAWQSAFAAVLNAAGSAGTNNLPAMLQTIFAVIVSSLDEVHCLMAKLNADAVKSDDKTRLFANLEEYPGILHRLDEISQIERRLNEAKKSVCKTLGFFNVNYVCVAGNEYLIEVKNDFLKSVPSSWMKISSTKTCGRFRPPEVQAAFGELCRAREKLQLAAEEAWQIFLENFSRWQVKLKHANENIAILDVLVSLAETAKAENLVRPGLTDEEGVLEISQGRHPVVARLLEASNEQFVPNDTNFTSSGYRCMILSGPNMGGKSCYVRQVAVIIIMAQMGSYVPADHAKLSLFDAIFTRMGSQDEILSGRSSFLTEMSETSNILEKSTGRSLVILDELGRGTGTHDGTAIAYAALEYILHHIKCLTLFVTHYPEVMAIEKDYPSLVKNFHLGYFLQPNPDVVESNEELVVFLYSLVEGPSPRSYGLNVAKMAGIPETLIQRGKEKSSELERIEEDNRASRKLFRELFA